MAARHPDKRIEVWFQDEARFGQKGTNSRVWARRGSRPAAPRQTQYEWVYLFGAVCPESGECNGWIVPVANTEVFNHTLADLSAQLAADVHAVLVLDQAGWHMAKDVAVPPNLTLLPLPPYSPQLNPVEQVWKHLRQRHLSNRVYPDVEALDKAVGDAWLSFVGDPAQVRSLCHYHWMAFGNTN